MSGEATILHADLDAFYASVEQRDDPRLRGRPVIVGGGVVLAASYEAKAFGVRTAMGGAQARRVCPHAIVVKPRMSAYSDASKAVFEVFEQTTPLVEGLSIDEAFLDVGGLRRVSGTPTEIARRLREEVARASRPGDNGRCGAHQVPRQGGERRGQARWAAGRAARPRAGLPPPLARRTALGCRARSPRPSCTNEASAPSVEVARLGEKSLVAMVGQAAGRKLHALAHNRDPRRVQVGRRRGSIGSQSALGRRRRSSAAVDSTLVAIVDRVTRRMRFAHRVGRTVVLRLRFEDFSRATRSHTLPFATAHTPTILSTARVLLASARPRIESEGLTLVGLAVGNLDDDRAVQLTLPFDRASGPALDVALDDVRARFGSAAITRAVLLGRDPGFTVPLLPD